MKTDLAGRIDRIVENLMGSYAGSKYIDTVNNHEHPDAELILDVLENLKIIIFQGFFSNKKCKVLTTKNNTSMLLEDVISVLSKQIMIVLPCIEKYRSLSEEELYDVSLDLTFRFLERIPFIRELLETDIQATYDGDPAAFNKDEIIFSYPGLYAILVNRIAHELHILGVPLIPRIMTEHAHRETGIDIHPGACIGKYFFIDHGTGIVIGETTTIGDNVKIYQGVTLGALSTRGGQRLKNVKRHPTICDNVTIYSGASILGGNTVIGKNVVIGGNTFITESVPEGTKVSVKNQELVFNHATHRPVERVKADEEDAGWFYVI